MKQLTMSGARGGTRLVTLFVSLLMLLVPGLALAAGGEDVELVFSQNDTILLIVSVAFGVIAIAFGFWLRAKVLRESPGDEKMQEVGSAIVKGALAYLAQQRNTISIFILLLGAGLFALYQPKFGNSIAGLLVLCFVLGVAASYIAGYLGMDMAVKANMRTAAAALTSYKKALEVSFQAGAVAGMITVGMGLLGAALIFLFARENAMKLLVGFGFGGSLAALFMRVGGGIYTKAADVGADLVGKVEAGIPEDDPRNPAVIADNVGDNVGDCAGMAADVFESYEVTLVAAIVLGAATAAIFPTEIWMKLILFALMARGVGIIASIIGILGVKGSDDVNVDPLKPIRKGFYLSAGVAAVLTAVLAFWMMGGMPTQNPVVESTTLRSVQEFTNREQAVVRRTQNDISRKLANVRIELRKIAFDLASKREDKDVTKVSAEDIAKDPRAAALMSRFGFTMAPANTFQPGTAETPKQREDFFTPEEFRTAVITPLVPVRAEDRNRKERPDLMLVNADLLAEAPAIKEYAKAQDMPMEMFKQTVLTAVAGTDPKAPVAPLPDLKGYSRLEWDDARLTNITVSTPAANFGQAPTLESFKERFEKADLDNSYVVYQLRITQTPPAAGPERPEAQTQTLFYGPVIKRVADEQIQQAVQQQGNALQVEKLAIFPTTWLINKEGELALGVERRSLSANVPADVKQRGVTMENPQRMTGFSGLQYYKAPKAEVERAQQTGQQPPRVFSVNQGVVEHNVAEWWKFALCIIFGIVMAFAFEILTDYYVSTHKRPVQEVAGVSSAGPAPMIIQGFALGLESSVFSLIAICVALVAPLLVFPPELYGGYLLSFYGIALVGLGLLTTTGFILAMDTFGPISDNAQGVFEMSGAGHKNPEAALAVQRLDAAGNTTKALTKGFAIATAVVAAVALFHSYIEAAQLTTAGMPLEVPEIFVGLLIGGAAPFLFSAFLINAVGRASFDLIAEVRRQFRNDPGIMAGTSKPDYGACVAIVTKAAQKELLGPGILAIALPLLVVFGLAIGKQTTVVNGIEYNLVGAQALGGFLAGTILSGQLLAVLLANSGGIWDNSKKLIEDGLYGGKGTDAHKAGVVCDTVGDPFKDTAGPALNPLIKVMNLVALLLAPYVIFPGDDNARIIASVLCLAALFFAFYQSKKGSISTAMQSMAEENKAQA